MTRLEELKQLFKEQRKPFPLSHLLYLYEIGSSRNLYINNMEGFRLLAGWLAPIEIPSTSLPIHKLHQSYDTQEIAKILSTTQGQILYGYQTTIQLLE